ncbi:hypothetical protein BDZ89DRAFT_7072 [Hymenopellis radicata]|nr:hypothetical protein BDZ89DRAFT_7072 [Hymenopellis radicata]
MPMELRSRDTEGCNTLMPPICSPTPRQAHFSFPERHNLNDSPFSTPSVSPFQPERYPTPNDFRPRTKKGDDGHIKRPENAFILFRRDMCRRINAAKAEGAKPNREADLSKTISEQWRTLPEEEKKKWKDLAEQKKQEHKAEFPHYKYRPQRKGGKNKKRGDSDVDEEEHDQDPDADYRPSRSGRGTTRGEKRSNESDGRVALFRPRDELVRPASAPNETSYPLYQEIYVPNMHLAPSCPNSPTPMPRNLPNFDYLVNEGLYGGYESSFPHFYPDIFDTVSTYGSTPASSCPSSPMLGPYHPHPDAEYANINPRLLEAEMDLDAHLRNTLSIHNDMYGWGEMDGIISNSDFDIRNLPPIDAESPGLCSNMISISNLLNGDDYDDGQVPFCNEGSGGSEVRK